MCMIYSTSERSGSFSTDGITQLSTTNSTFVQCRSEHLTSFAVLVDATGVSVFYKIIICMPLINI